MDNELKPCPFCGGKAPIVVKEVQYPDTPHARMWYAVECNACDAVGDWDLGESGAIEKWNTRPGEDALRARIAELETACNGQRRAEYDADEMRRALQHVRAVLSRGRTVGHDHQQAALDAENFIVGLSESDDEELDAICSKCGQRMEHVRPGKWQCDCQARTVTHD